MSKPQSPEDLLARGVADPRAMLVQVPYALELPSDAEANAMRAVGHDPDGFAVLRIGFQRLDLQINPADGTAVLVLQALLPRNLLQLQASRIIAPDVTGPGQQLAAALGPAELRLVLMRTFFAETVALPEPVEDVEE